MPLFLDTSTQPDVQPKGLNTSSSQERLSKHASYVLRFSSNATDLHHRLPTQGQMALQAMCRTPWRSNLRLIKQVASLPRVCTGRRGRPHKHDRSGLCQATSLDIDAHLIGIVWVVCAGRGSGIPSSALVAPSSYRCPIYLVMAEEPGRISEVHVAPLITCITIGNIVPRRRFHQPHAGPANLVCQTILVKVIPPACRDIAITVYKLKESFVPLHARSKLSEDV